MISCHSHMSQATLVVYKELQIALVFFSFVITRIPLPEDSLWTSSETYCKIQDTRPVLFHSYTSTLCYCKSCLLDTPIQHLCTPQQYLFPYRFEDLYPPLVAHCLPLFSKGKLLKNQLVTCSDKTFPGVVLAQSGPDNHSRTDHQSVPKDDQ